jgi:membrane protein implicated in regulation of membrane protease activity
MCHLILLMPVFALVVFWIWPLSVAGPVYAVIAGLSLWMYAYIWRAMQRPVLGGAEELLHSDGEVVEVNGTALRVRVHSEMWNAESTDSLHRGDHVKVVGMTGLILQVRRLDDTAGNLPRQA